VALVDLAGMDLFVAIVEGKSLSGAARSLGLPKATVSRRLTQMEQSLGVPLVIRSTRALSLTDAGRRLFERVSPLVAEARLACLEAQQGAEPSGLLRLSVSAAFGQLVVFPQLLRFLQDHPAIRLDLHLSDDRVNLIADGYDLVIRMGEMEDSDLLARKFSVMPNVLVASPAYLAAHGEPSSPADLPRHQAIIPRPNLDRWTCGGETVRLRWKISTGMMSLNCQAARAGLGIAVVPYFMVADDLRSGSLRRVLPDYELPGSTATMLTARTGTRSPALSALMDFLLRYDPRQEIREGNPIR
jgi:DNA-binding transcriptional LysR family regulator